MLDRLQNRRGPFFVREDVRTGASTELTLQQRMQKYPDLLEPKTLMVRAIIQAAEKGILRPLDPNERFSLIVHATQVLDEKVGISIVDGGRAFAEVTHLAHNDFPQEYPTVGETFVDDFMKLVRLNAVAITANPKKPSVLTELDLWTLHQIESAGGVNIDQGNLFRQVPQFIHTAREQLDQEVNNTLIVTVLNRLHQLSILNLPAHDLIRQQRQDILRKLTAQGARISMEDLEELALLFQVHSSTISKDLRAIGYNPRLTRAKMFMEYLSYENNLHRWQSGEITTSMIAEELGLDYDTELRPSIYKYRDLLQIPQRTRRNCKN